MRRRDFVALAGGALIAWPAAVRGQTAMPMIGFLSSGAPDASRDNLSAFREGLKEAGRVEHENVTIEYRWADGYDRLAAMAAELVQRRVAVIVAAGGVPPARAAQAATTTIPVIFSVGGDPVALGLVSSLNHPGGNVTGVTNFNLELGQKRLELLHQAAPAATNIALLVNPTTGLAEPLSRDLQAAARSLGLGVQILQASTEQDIDAAFEALVRSRADALVVGADAYFYSRSDQLAALAARYRVPAIGSFRRFADAGGLISYGTDNAELFHLMGVYTGKILGGARPADLPVLQSTRFELVINLKSAKALGLEIPATLLGSADAVIE